MARFASIALMLVMSATASAIAAEANDGELQALPKPVTDGKVSLEKAIATRRSGRSFSDKGLTMAEIGQILWAAQGITDEKAGLRASPSAGALYPLELFVCTSEGVVRYVPKVHKLETVEKGDKRKALSEAALGQPWVAQAPVVIVIAAVPSRTTAKYGERGLRYILIEAGHAGQNIQLQAVALGLVSVPVGAFSDKDLAKVLSLPEGMSPLYIICIGRPKG